MERTVSIAGKKADLLQALDSLKEGVEQGGVVAWSVVGNGERTPRLNLELSVEEHDEFTEPVVDYED